MKLSLTRRAHEWAVETVDTEESFEEALVECPTRTAPEETGLVKSRFTFRRSPDSVRVQPAAPDRNLVVYPESAFHIIAGESITLFCSIPLWAQVAIDGGETLVDRAIARPADTWFGPSTREGELCYATTTIARLDRNAVPRRAHRAVTELAIHNFAPDTLHLERINLAVPYLSVFSRDGSLETESVTLERTSGDTMGKLDIGEPPRGSGVEKVTAARLSREAGGTLVRAFSAWFD
jgi:hypothetical protein